MNKVQARRLLKLADFLDKLSPKVFDLSIINNCCEFTSAESRIKMQKAAKSRHACGTVGCAIGYAPLALPSLFKYGKFGSVLTKNGDGSTNSQIEKFGLRNYSDWCLLFTSDNYADEEDTKPKVVAKRIREYVADRLGEYASA